MQSGLDGRVVWVTGASGGIGRALARELAGEGCGLLLTAGTRLAELERFAAEAQLPRALCLAADVRDAAACERAADAAVARFGRLDGVVANAGAWPSPDVPLWELDPARLRATLDTNLIGTVFTFRAFGRALARTGPHPDGGGAAAVAIGSTAGRFGERGHADYAAAKAGLHGLVQSLKNELPRLDPRARVNLIEPGWTVTEMARPALDDDAAVRRALATMALPQLGAATDVARAACFLLSPRLAAHLTGQTLTIAGGMEGRILHDPATLDPTSARRR